MAMTDDLFGDLGVAEITYSGGSRRDWEVEAAWQEYADLTKRPDAATPDREFAKTYRYYLKANYAHEVLLQTVRGAARMPVRPRDPRDVRRVVMALDHSGHEATALAALAADDPIVLYPREDIVLRAKIRDLEDACETGRLEWTSRDHEACGMLIQRFDRAELLDIGERVALKLGTDAILPVDILRNLYSAEDGKVAINAGRNTYHAGAAERAKAANIEFEADVAAQRMKLAGAPVDDIQAFHDQAPAEYWDAVLDLLDADVELDCAAAYDLLRPEWGWHPGDRQ